MSGSTRKARARARWLGVILAGFATAPVGWSTPASWHPQEIVVGPVPPEYDDGDVEQWITDDERQTSPFYRARFEDEYVEDLKDGRIVFVARTMVAQLRRQDWQDHALDKKFLLNQLEMFLVAVEDSLAAPGIDGALDTNEEQALFLQGLKNTGRGAESLRPDVLEEDGPLVYFPGRDEARPQGLPLWTYDEAASDAQDDDVYRLNLTRRQVRDWRMLEHALTNLVFEQIKKVLSANVRDLRHAVTRWENYLDRGYSQYPWESLFNGWALDLPELGPPDRQWMLLHPTLGLEMSVDPPSRTRIDEAMNIEVLGHLWYTGEDLDNYRGLSLTVNLRDDIRPGIGALFHFRRNINLGVAWHDVDDDPFLFFSVDLFRFASSKRDEYQQEYERLRSRLGDR